MVNISGLLSVDRVVFGGCARDQTYAFLSLEGFSGWKVHQRENVFNLKFKRMFTF